MIDWWCDRDRPREKDDDKEDLDKIYFIAVTLSWLSELRGTEDGTQKKKHNKIDWHCVTGS